MNLAHESTAHMHWKFGDCTSNHHESLERLRDNLRCARIDTVLDLLCTPLRQIERHHCFMSILFKTVRAFSDRSLMTQTLLMPRLWLRDAHEPSEEPEELREALGSDYILQGFSVSNAAGKRLSKHNRSFSTSGVGRLERDGLALYRTLAQALLHLGCVYPSDRV